jgi:hypothetical protein
LDEASSASLAGFPRLLRSLSHRLLFQVIEVEKDMRYSLGFCVSAALFVFPGAVSAQQVTTPQPRLSPYLNILRGGATPAGNYLTLTRPEVSIRNSLQQVSQQAQSNTQQITGLEANALPATGHPFGFQNHLIYFNNLSGGGAAGAGGGVAPPVVGGLGVGTGVPGGFGGGIGVRPATSTAGRR